MPKRTETAEELACVETTDLFWDCECEKNYIHLKSRNFCVHCGCHQKDQPDSRVSEVRALMSIDAIQLVRIRD